MTSLRINPKIMKNARGIRPVEVNNLIAFPEMALEKGDEAPEVLFLETVVKRKDEQIRSDKKDSKKKPQAKIIFQFLKFNFDGQKG